MKVQMRFEKAGAMSKQSPFERPFLLALRVDCMMFLVEFGGSQDDRPRKGSHQPVTPSKQTSMYSRLT